MQHTPLTSEHTSDHTSLEGGFGTAFLELEIGDSLLFSSLLYRFKVFWSGNAILEWKKQMDLQWLNKNL